MVWSRWHNSIFNTILFENFLDALIIGDFGLSYAQSRAQFAMWSMWSSPLYMSNDLRKLDPKSKKILQNKKIIAVNQDPMGAFGKRVLSVWKQLIIWLKRPIDWIIFFNSKIGLKFG